VQAVVFCGIQASGKTSFYAQRFLHTHVRISMDLMRTRHRERRFLETCLATGQRFVVDNTNPTAAERESYVRASLASGYQVVGYEFVSTPREALARNAERAGRQQIPVAGVLATHKRFEPLTPAEGYSVMHLVQITPDGGFTVAPHPADASA
jgi:predicted kinase